MKIAAIMCLLLIVIYFSWLLWVWLRFDGDNSYGDVDWNLWQYSKDNVDMFSFNERFLAWFRFDFCDFNHLTAMPPCGYSHRPVPHPTQYVRVHKWCTTCILTVIVVTLCLKVIYCYYLFFHFYFFNFYHACFYVYVCVFIYLFMCISVLVALAESILLYHHIHSDLDTNTVAS